MMQHVLRITVSDIRNLRRGSTGPLETQLLELLSQQAHTGSRAPVFVRIDFPRDVGGIEIRCRRGFWAWLANAVGWRARRAVPIWRDDD